MKTYIRIVIACIFIIVALNLTSCQQCIKAHDVPYAYYTSHCVQYDSNGNCLMNVPLLNHGYESHCDEWENK